MNQSSVARASAWMALGTIVSRVTGFARLIMVGVAIGLMLDADLFNTANTIPNTMYILVAGGVFNVVLVPQLVRAMRRDPDGGEAYAQRVISLGLTVLGVATVALLLAVPLLMRIVFTADLFTEPLREQRADAQFLMYLCLPQVFFYGAFVLIGQILNARQRFGPMMWAPIINNLVAISVLVAYVAIFGSSNGEDGFSRSQMLLLGIGSTAGIVAQTLVLLPYLRRSGFTLRWRTDWRGVGLSHTLRLGAWTLGFIVASQIAYLVVVRLGTRGTTRGQLEDVPAAGTAVYDIGFLVSQLPHGVITVSLATAVMPLLSSLSSDRDLVAMRRELGRTVRTCMVLIAPLAVAVAALGHELGGLLRVWRNLDASAGAVGSTVSYFALAMVLFTWHYLMLRGFYADEDTRTPFLIQVAIAVTNIVLAVILVRDIAPIDYSSRLALAYGCAYAVGVVASTVLLSRRIGPMIDREMLSYLARLALACGSTGAVMVLLQHLIPVGNDTAGGSLVLLLGAGLGGALTYVGACFALRLRELTQLTTVLRRR